MTVQPFRLHMPPNPSRARVVTQRAYEKAIDRANAAETVDEMIAARDDVAKRKRAYGAILLSEDKEARPHIYDKGRSARRARARARKRAGF